MSKIDRDLAGALKTAKTKKMYFALVEKKLGEGTLIEWPIGLGGKGNDGVASLVSLIPGSIGYLEYSYALQRLDKMAMLPLGSSSTEDR